MGFALRLCLTLGKALAEAGCIDVLGKKERVPLLCSLAHLLELNIPGTRFGQREISLSKHVLHAEGPRFNLWNC